MRETLSDGWLRTEDIFRVDQNGNFLQADFLGLLPFDIDRL
jgi:hypothetical protein